MSINSRHNQVSWSAALLAVGLLLGGGWSYRALADHLDALFAEPIQLPRPLAALPMVIGEWEAEEVPVPDAMRRVTGNDDLVSRRYVNRNSYDAVLLYVGFTGRPRTMLGHRPAVCYPSAGWLHDRTTDLDIRGTVAVTCQTHLFSSPRLSQPRQLVLNFYVLNGRITRDADAFRGIGWRDPNIGRDAGRYVAQVQVTVSVLGGVDAATRTAETFVEDAADEILALLPGTAQNAADRAAQHDGPIEHGER